VTKNTSLVTGPEQPHNLSGKWWAKPREKKQRLRLWQGLQLHRFGLLIHHDDIYMELINLSGRDLIARISATAGFIDRPGHSLGFQLDWQWKVANVQRTMPSKTIGSAILESKVPRTNQEQKFYDATWEVNVSGRNLIP